MGTWWSSDEQIFPRIQELGNVYGPTNDGCYYIYENIFSSIYIRYRFTKKKWEWKRGNLWEEIPKALTIRESSKAALEYLQAKCPYPPLDKHIIERVELGNGAFGQVYKVKFGKIMGHEKIVPENVFLALKTIKIADPSSLSTVLQKLNQQKALENEIIILASLDHPAVIQFYRCIPLHGAIAMVTEYCNGGTAQSLQGLYKLLIPENIINQMIAHCLQGLDYLHSKELIHRDLKPDNIFISYSNNGQRIFKIGDFGLAKVMSNSFGSLAGCIAFFAPEIFITNETTKKSDIYALGLSIFNMCSKTLPRIPGTITRVNAYSNEINNFILTTTNLNPNQRKTTTELLTTFTTIVQPHKL